MKTNILLKRSAILMIAAISLILSCSDEELITGEEVDDISEEAMTDAYFHDIDDMVGVIVEAPSEAQFANGRTQAIFQVSDSRFACDGSPLTITLEKDVFSTAVMPRGKITIHFGNGCTDLRGNVRTGKIIINYFGRRFVPKSMLSVRCEDYTINGTKVEATRLLTYVTGSTELAPKFIFGLNGGKLTFPDNSIAERNTNISAQWIRGGTPAEDKLIIEEGSTAEGITRTGRDYKLTVEKQLEYKRFCGTAVSGIKHFLVNNYKDVIVDYGDGECDKNVSITVDGSSKNIRIK